MADNSVLSLRNPMLPRTFTPLCALGASLTLSSALFQTKAQAQVKIVLPPIPKATTYAPTYAPAASAPRPVAPAATTSPASFQSPASTTPPPPAKFEPGPNIVYHGASLPDTWNDDGLRRQISQYDAAAGKKISVVTWFASVYENGVQKTWQQSYAAPLARVKKWGAYSLIKFSTIDYAFDSTAKQARLADIARGTWDGYFVEAAQTVKQFGGPTFISIDHEMNGDWYAYSQDYPGSGQTAADYVAAWKRIVSIFRQQGANNVAWVWSPNVPNVGKTPYTSYYPGDDYVDWIGISYYSGNDMNAMQPIYSTYANKKPFFITEWATAPEQSQHNHLFPGDVPWVQQFFAALSTRYPRVKAISWFNWNQADGNFLLTRVPQQAAVYSQNIANPRYLDQAPGAALPQNAIDIPRLEVPSTEVVLKEVPATAPPPRRSLAEIVKIEPVKKEIIRRE